MEARKLQRRSSVRWGAALALGLVSAAAGAGVTVRGLRFEPGTDGTRIVLDLSGPATESVFTLDHPARVVVDLSGTSLNVRQVHVPAGQGLVQKIRVGPRDGGTLRVVFEVGADVKARTSRLGPPGVEGHRLVVELSGPAAAAAVLASPAMVSAPPPAPRAERAARPVRDLVIAVDAGHGGVDPGATGRDGTREKDVTLAIARVLAARINAEPGMRAVLTRDADHFVELRERIRRARAAQADLFVSVHADAVVDRSVTGSSVYVLSARGATSEAAKWLADRENAADLVGGVSLDNKDQVLASVLLDLSQSAAMSASMVAAEKVLDELNEVGEVRRARVQQAGFVVLKSPDIPSMLIESAYITNPGEERRLRDPRHQAQLAEAILTGVRKYFRQSPPPGTRIAALVSARADAAEGSSIGRALRP